MQSHCETPPPIIMLNSNCLQSILKLHVMVHMLRMYCVDQQKALPWMKLHNCTNSMYAYTLVSNWGFRNCNDQFATLCSNIISP